MNIDFDFFKQAPETTDNVVDDILCHASFNNYTKTIRSLTHSGKSQTECCHLTLLARKTDSFKVFLCFKLISSFFTSRVTLFRIISVRPFLLSLFFFCHTFISYTFVVLIRRSYKHIGHFTKHFHLSFIYSKPLKNIWLKYRNGTSKRNMLTILNSFQRNHGLCENSWTT